MLAGNQTEGWKKCWFQSWFLLKKIPCQTETTRSMVGGICPRCPISLQLGTGHQGRPEKTSRIELGIKPKQKRRKALKQDRSIIESGEEPCWTAGGWKGAICWSASSGSPRSSGSHGGRAPWASSPAPCASVPLFHKHREFQALRGPGACMVVVATYYSSQAQPHRLQRCYHPAIVCCNQPSCTFKPDTFLWWLNLNFKFHPASHTLNVSSSAIHKRKRAPKHRI